MSDATNFDFSGLNFDLSDLSDQPAAVQKKFEVKTRESNGPSEDQLLVAAILNNCPGKRALTAVKVMVLVRRFKNMPEAEVLEETTVRGWLNRAVEAGLIAKGTGKSGFCALDSEDRASEEELQKRRDQVAAARAAKVEKDKAEMKDAQAAADATPATDESDPLAALGL